MLFPINKVQAVAFFNMINHLHEQASIIITTNKSSKQWAETFEDEVLATALLDRLLYRCEVVKLKETSYRMDNRQTIFPEKNKKINRKSKRIFLKKSGEILLLKIDESKFAIYNNLAPPIQRLDFLLKVSLYITRIGYYESLYFCFLHYPIS